MRSSACPAGPSVDASGTVYVACDWGTGPSGALVAVDASGQVKWRIRLPGSPTGDLVIGPNRTIYVLVGLERDKRGYPTHGSLLAIGEK